MDHPIVANQFTLRIAPEVSQRNGKNGTEVQRNNLQHENFNGSKAQHADLPPPFCQKQAPLIQFEGHEMHTI